MSITEAIAETTAGLTGEEHEAMEVSRDLWGRLTRIVSRGPSRSGDLHELGSHVHAIQQAILSQAGARAHPDRYRLLGDDVVAPAPTVHEGGTDGGNG